MSDISRTVMESLGIHYQSETGLFTRNGKPMGFDHGNGYLRSSIGKRKVYLHRLAWIWMYGEVPECIDHINGIKGDNRIANLRAATKSQNGMNRGKNRNNTSGFKGVSFFKPARKWVAEIMVRGKKLNLGYYPSPYCASNAYQIAAGLLHKEFRRYE